MYALLLKTFAFNLVLQCLEQLHDLSPLAKQIVTSIITDSISFFIFTINECISYIIRCGNPSYCMLFNGIFITQLASVHIVCSEECDYDISFVVSQ